MKALLTILILMSAMVSRAQDMAMPIAKELNLIKFMTGRWSGTMTSTMGGNVEKGQGAIVSKMTMGGRYLEGDHTYKSKTMGAFSGKQLTGYNAAKKQFYAYWFDSMGDGAVEFWGAFNGNSLIMVSKPYEMPGMPPSVMRVTYKKLSNRKMDFLLEMKDGEKWTKAMTATFTKD